MEKIESFKIDHTKLGRGVYLSRTTFVPYSQHKINTYDVRLVSPAKGETISARTMHTIEHIGATWLRNQPRYCDKVVYWGPMGCQTGFYLILCEKGETSPTEVSFPILLLMEYISEYDGEIPGDSEVECGQAGFHDLEGARAVARVFVEAYKNNELEYEYVFVD